MAKNEQSEKCVLPLSPTFPFVFSIFFFSFEQRLNSSLFLSHVDMFFFILKQNYPVNKSVTTTTITIISVSSFSTSANEAVSATITITSAAATIILISTPSYGGGGEAKGVVTEAGHREEEYDEIHGWVRKMTSTVEKKKWWSWWRATEISGGH
ncbi:hypothetical protein HID58_048291 [Brassica napus]|uniref:Transmembrane protein n=1 Tax=Brassica napus TaxID=3708 RepID=A0ABQ8B209_BRANA|nr:hypothetical protein HID58_048291 [Brassica napus]